MTLYSISARKAIDIGDTDEEEEEEEVEDADPCEYVSEVGKSKLSHEFAVSDTSLAVLLVGDLVKPRYDELIGRR